MDPAAAHHPLEEPIDLECTVVEARLREPGFYETATRVFYVTPRRDVYLLQAPGAALTLQAVDDLPHGASAVARAAVDAPRRELAALIDRHGARPDLTERTAP
ncbi:hypothetical protein [Nannocystis bainbridge]|uniref:Uncharacterized protein n=1 Tax=Nannocystis bainbridge TaxID=2995303 RepID=A0ABT5E9E9_9BACT|nr:hypothetical protein [Nannocystis bainbridge]MDC0722487.1 hypothetical protein [Nannocystis bainbridge]